MVSKKYPSRIILERRLKKEEKDDFDFGERFIALKTEEEAMLNKRILKNLSKIEYEK